MAIPVLENWLASDTGGNTATSLTLTAPSGIEADELLLIIVGSDDSSDSLVFSTAESGWAKLGENANAGDSACHIAVFWKIASGSEGNVQIDHNTSDEILGWYMRITGVDTSAPINDSHFMEWAARPNLLFSNLTADISTDVDDCLIIAGGSTDGGDLTPFGALAGAASGPWSKVAGSEHTSGTTGNDVAGLLITKPAASQGTQGGVVYAPFSSGSDGNASVQIALAPAASGPQTIGPLTGIASAEAIGTPSIKYDQTVSGTAGGIASAEAIGSAAVLLDQAIIPTGIPGPDAGSGDTTTYYFDASVSGPTDNDAAWSSPEMDAFDGSLATDSACSREGTVDNDELRGTGSTAPASGGAISQVRVRLYAGVYIADNNTMFAEILDGVTSLGIAENHHDYQDKDWGAYVTLDAPAGGWTWAKLNTIECVLYGYSSGSGWHKVANRVDLEVTTSGTSSLGTPQLNLTLLMTGVATAEAVGTLSALAGNVDIVPTGIATVEAVGSLEVILAGGADQDLLSVGGIATVEAIGTLEILAGNVDVVPTGIATAEVVGDLTLLAGNVDVVPTGIATAEAIGSAQLDLTLVTTGIATAEAIGSAQLDLTLLMAGVATAEAIGDLTLLAGNVNVVPTGIASAEAIGDLEVTLGGGVPQYVSPDGVGSAEAVGSHTLAPGNVDIVATGIATAEAVGTPSVNYGILITGITSEELVPEPVLLPGNVNIGASGIATAEVVPDPLVESDPSIVPTGIASEETFGSANFLSEYTLVATGIASAETIGSHIATTGYIFVPTGVPSGEAHGSALIGMEITGVGGIATAEAIGSINVIDSTNHIGAIGIPTSEQIGTAVILGGAQYTSSIFSRVFHPTFRGIFRKTISTRF